MPKSDIVVEYEDLTQKEAFDKIKNIFNDAIKQHGDKISNLSQEWKEKDFKGKASFQVNIKVKGINVSGKLTGDVEVFSKKIKLTVEYPVAALPFKGRVEEMFRNGAKTLLKRKK